MYVTSLLGLFFPASYDEYTALVKICNVAGEHVSYTSDETLGSGACEAGFTGDDAHRNVEDSSAMYKAGCADDEALRASFILNGPRCQASWSVSGP